MRKFLYDFDKEIQEAKASIIRDKKHELYVNIKANNPVDTGLSKDSWVKTERGFYNKQDYVYSLNNGTSTRPGTRFLENAIRQTSGVNPDGIVLTPT